MQLATWREDIDSIMIIQMIKKQFPSKETDKLKEYRGGTDPYSTKLHAEYHSRQC